MARPVGLLVRGRHRSGRLCQSEGRWQDRGNSHQSQPRVRTRDPTHPESRRRSDGRCRAGLAIGMMQTIPIDPHLANTLLTVFDLAGTFIFALSGATKAVEHKLDIFGVLVLCFAAGNSGGIARDIMIGALPPAAINDWAYLAVSVLAGVITFFWYSQINRLSSPVLLFDAAGLGLFVAAGTGKALAFHVGPV